MQVKPNVGLVARGAVSSVAAARDDPLQFIGWGRRRRRRRRHDEVVRPAPLPALLPVLCWRLK